MYIDALPILSFHRMMRATARNVALRNEARATGMVGLSNGDALPWDTIVRFDIATGEEPGQQLAQAFTLTKATAFWFYGGDPIARHAASSLTLSVQACGAVFARRMDPLAPERHITLRKPGVRDRMTLGEVRAQYAPGFLAPQTLFAVLHKEVVGVALSEALDAVWTEVRVIVYPAHRGRGIGTAILSALADRLEGLGRLVCGALESSDARGRSALERSGFRVADYYFIGRPQR